MKQFGRYIYIIGLQISNILGILFIIYYILDQYNPLMNFLHNQISELLLLAFAIITIVCNEISVCYALHKKVKNTDPNRTKHHTDTEDE